jgi:hypothetical protein
VFLKGPYCSGKKFLLDSVCEEFKYTRCDLDILNFHEKYKIVFFPGMKFKSTDILVIHHIEWFDKKDQKYILDNIHNINTIPVVFVTTEFFMMYYKFRKLARFLEIQIPKPSLQTLECMFPGIPKHLLLSQSICTIKNEQMMMVETDHRVKRRKVYSEPQNIFQFYNNPTDEFACIYPVGDMVIANCNIRDTNDLLGIMQLRHQSSEITMFFNMKLLKKYKQPRMIYPSVKILRPVSDQYYKRRKIIDESLKTYKSMKPVMDHWFQVMHTNTDIVYPVLRNTNINTSNKARMILF